MTPATVCQIGALAIEHWIDDDAVELAFSTVELEVAAYALRRLGEIINVETTDKGDSRDNGHH